MDGRVAAGQAGAVWSCRTWLVLAVAPRSTQNCGIQKHQAVTGSEVTFPFLNLTFSKKSASVFPLPSPRLRVDLGSCPMRESIYPVPLKTPHTY